MKNICVIGSGISGLSVSNLLIEKGYDVTIYESKKTPGGLIKCDIIDGAVYHRVGGHVFNTKIPEVKEWFNKKVLFEKTFLPSDRNAKILLDKKFVNYPIENNIYQLDKNKIELIIKDLLSSKKIDTHENFDTFLLNTFGKTLYDLYFKPYNDKIWNIDLSSIPLEWLAGKLPMPNIEEIMVANFSRSSEKGMVHSKFYYPKNNGSQHIVNSLKKNLNIIYNSEINEIQQTNNKWIVKGEEYDHVVYTGDIRKLKELLSINVDPSHFKSNGTTNVFCEIDKTDISWLYIPEKDINCHRIIFSGNFSPNNNGIYKNTCTIEYSGFKNLDEIKKDILKLPFNIKVIDYNYEPLSYIIQSKDSKTSIKAIKTELGQNNFHLLGRFAEWEYYNMDTAMNVSMELIKNKF